MHYRKLNQVLAELAVSQKQIAELINKRPDKSKDNWDKFAAISVFLSTVIIAGMGAYFTQVFNNRQNERNAALKDQEIRVAQIQTVEKFIPHLTGTEDQKRLAVLLINALGNPEIATKLATLYPSEGTIGALKSIAQSGTDNERASAKQALQSIFDRQRKAVVQLATKAAQPQPFASGFIVTATGYVITADYTMGVLPYVIITADGIAHDATTIDVNKSLGVALLKMSGTEHPVLPFGNPRALGNDSVLAIGTKGDLALQPAMGRISKDDANYVYVKFEFKVNGFGGGPVVDREGRMIGMVYKGSLDDDSLDMCVRSEVIRKYLMERKITVGQPQGR